MNRRNFLQLGLSALAATSASHALGQIGVAPTRIGRMSLSAFERLNLKGRTAVPSVRLDRAPLSAADQQLLMELALGGMMQLEVSRLALRKALMPDVRILAQAEVEERAGLSAKLQDLTAAKGAPLPAMPNRRAQALLAMMGRLSGA